MSVIRKLHIRHFKSIWDDTIELGRLNVFIGTNGAGKSNILEAIAMASASIDGGIDYPKLHQRGARLSAPDIFRSSFKNKGRNQTFSIGIEMDDVKYNMSIRSKNEFSYFTEIIKTKHDVDIAGRGPAGAKIGDFKLPFLDKTKSIVPFAMSARSGKVSGLADLSKYAIYLPSTPILRGSSEDSSRLNPLGLYGGRLAGALNDIMVEIDNKEQSQDLRRFFILLNWFKSFGPRHGIDTLLKANDQLLPDDIIVQYTDKYMRTDFNKLSAYDVSEGALYILFVLVLLIHNKTPNIFALDNIDSALNPGLVTNLINHIADIVERDKGKQILMTTHNPTTLDALDLFNDEHRLFVVERKADGQTKTTRISPPEGMTKEMWEEAYYGMKLSDIWLSGAIGGLPKGL